ncbi:MAG TPA: hypothetical protein VHG10_12960 [Glycomyces sp.]|nr:hypothetical protein [Glycomyces sp.]
MHRKATLAALTAALALATAACGGSDAGPEEPAADPTMRPQQERTALPTPSPRPFPTAADGEDYGACFDGECEVLVTVGIEIEFDGDFRVPPTTVEQISDAVTVVARDSSGYLSFNLGVGGRGNFQNSLNVEVIAVQGEQAVLRFWPGEAGR